MTVDEMLTLARAHHQAGRLREAGELYRLSLEQQPRRLDVIDALAEVLFRSGNPAGATELLQWAISIEPGSASAHANLGIALAAQRRFEEAIPHLHHALSLSPALPHIITNLAAALRNQGKLNEAIATYRQAIALAPSSEGYYSLAGCLREAGQLDEALEAYRQAVHLRCDSFQASNGLATCLHLKGRFREAVAEYQRAIALRPDSSQAWNNVSLSLQELGRLEEAATAVRRAIELDPTSPEAFYNLGCVLLAQRNFDQSAAASELALKLRPGYVEARNNLAIALEAAGKTERAISEYRAVLAARPDWPEARLNYGVALKNSGRVDEAIAVYREVLQAAPSFEEARLNLGMALLLKGDFANGWREYESRRKTKRISGIRDFPQPRWFGEPLRGRRILLHAEQGLGDAIQLIRYAPLVQQAGGHVIVLCYSSLRRIAARQAGIDQLVTDFDPLPEFELHCPLLSLPGVMHTTLTTIPAAIPYLSCDDASMEKWRVRLSDQPTALKIGIVWAGNPGHTRDLERSIPLAAFAPLAELKNVRLFSLQKGERSADVRTPPSGLEVVDYTAELYDFADTAALIANLDLVIAADTAVAHLAGALGKPVWVLLPVAPDWRWMLDREDSPWYPTMRLFRQTHWGDWSMPIKSLVQQLKSFQKTAFEHE